jgi:hypothetical protein
VVWVGHANAVWAQKAYTVFICNFSEVLFQAHTFTSHLFETTGNDDGTLDALLAAFFQCLRNNTCGQHEHRQVCHLWQIKDAPVCLEISYLLFIGVDGVDGALKAKTLDGSEQVGSHGSDAIGSPKKNDASGIGDGVKGTLFN